MLASDLGRLGYPLLNAIEDARKSAAEAAFVEDAHYLLTTLSGKPGEGASECIMTVKSDLLASETFLNKWRHHQNDYPYKDVLDIVCGVSELLREFDKTYDSMTFIEKAGARLTAWLAKMRRASSRGPGAGPFR